jgi:hypothetical protein
VTTRRIPPVQVPTNVFDEVLDEALDVTPPRAPAARPRPAPGVPTTPGEFPTAAPHPAVPPPATAARPVPASAQVGRGRPLQAYLPPEMHWAFKDQGREDKELVHAAKAS